MKNQQEDISPNEKILRQLALENNMVYKDVRKIIHHVFSEMSDAFGKEGVTSIEWVGIGKFLVSEPRAKYVLAKKLSKVHHGKLIMERDGVSERMIKAVAIEEKNVALMKTKIKDDKSIEFIRRVEEQLATKVVGERVDSPSVRGENEDMQGV